MITSIRRVVYHQGYSDYSRWAEQVKAVQESLPWASCKEVDLEFALALILILLYSLFKINIFESLIVFKTRANGSSADEMVIFSWENLEVGHMVPVWYRLIVQHSFEIWFLLHPNSKKCNFDDSSKMSHYIIWLWIIFHMIWNISYLIKHGFIDIQNIEWCVWETITTWWPQHSRW